MITLLSDCHFWTTREDVRIKNTDFGTFRYSRNKEVQNQQQDIFAEAKREYTEKRNGLAVLKNSRKSAGRLKDNIKRLEEILRNHRVITIHWSDASQCLLLFANGIIAHISIDIFTGDILRMVYEKYLIGKLAADSITDAFFTRTHIVLAYNTNQVTVVHLQKPNSRPQGPEKISNMEPKIFHAIIPGTPERKQARHLSVNSSNEMFVIWTNSSHNEVFPWRPTMRDQDRANIHVFKLKGNQLDFFAYCWSDNDPIFVDFVRSSEGQILTLEQKISRKGEISAEICSYDITVGKMQRCPLSSIPVGTQITCFAFSPDQEKLFLGSLDRNICLHDMVMQTTKCVAQIDIIPAQCSWHSDSSIIMISNKRSQFQCFDLALTPIGNQLQSEDVTPSNLLDLSHHFTIQPILQQISFSRKPELQHYTQNYATTDCFLLLLYDQGPIGCLRFFAGAGMRGDIHNSGLTADVILDKYLALNQLEKAVNLLCALNWETYGAMCLISLHKIANYVFYRGDLKKTRIDFMARALKTFSETLTEETKDEFSDQVFDLKRRFFFFLLRREQYADAFEVAQDIEDYDLFMDLYNCTKSNQNLIEFSTACFSQAAAILHEEDRANGKLSMAGDYCSESEAGSSSSDTMNAVGAAAAAPSLPTKSKSQTQQQKFLKNYVPPLPSLKSKVLNAEMIQINIPKPELRPTRPQQQQQQQQQQERSRPPPPPVPDKKEVRLHSTIKIPSSNTPAAHHNALSSNLADLSLKNNNSALNHQQNGIASTSVQHWHQSTIINPAHKSAFSPPSAAMSYVHNVPPRAGPSNVIPINGMPTGMHTHANNHTYLHLASPVIITDNHIAAVVPMQQQQMLSGAIAASASSSSSSISAMHQPKFFQHPLVSGTIPPTSISFAAHSISNEEYQKVLLSKKPTASILSNGSATQNGSNTSSSVLSSHSSAGQNGSSSNKDGAGFNKITNGEKNKVKFSDTVQVAVVPEIPRKDKNLLIKRNGYTRPLPSRNFTNPKKELQDSLPLCHPNDDYLKDFNPLSTAESLRSKQITNKDEQQHHTNNSHHQQHQTTQYNKHNPSSVNNNTSSTSTNSSTNTTNNNNNASSIKVVHFGVV